MKLVHKSGPKPLKNKFSFFLKNRICLANIRPECYLLKLFENIGAFSHLQNNENIFQQVASENIFSNDAKMKYKI
jgi:hypothetical protein